MWLFIIAFGLAILSIPFQVKSFYERLPVDERGALLMWGLIAGAFIVLCAIVLVFESRWLF